jgi:hypothetical protein
MSNVKNVEAFGKLTGICTGYGGSYNPGQPNLQVTAMNTLLSQARATLQEVHVAKTVFENVTNTREVMFRDMMALSSRAISWLRASGAAPLTVDDAQASFRKMYGRRLTTPAPTATETAAAPTAPPRKARGLDYASVCDAFAKLVESLQAEPKYQPNEPELSVAALSNLLITLRQQNDVVNQARAALTSARNKRTTLLYSGANNLVAVGRAVKQYVRSVFGPRSLQQNEVSGIYFTKPIL